MAAYTETLDRSDSRHKTLVDLKKILEQLILNLLPMICLRLKNASSKIVIAGARYPESAEKLTGL